MVPQAPQLRGSEVVLTHMSLHLLRPAAHTHTPPTQVSVLPQRTAQAPQLLGSLIVFTQMPEHAI